MINFRVLKNFTQKNYYNKMRQMKEILQSIMLTEAAFKRKYHDTSMGRQTKWTKGYI